MWRLQGTDPGWPQFARFLTVGGVVGGATLAIRELVALWLVDDTPQGYLLSTILAYGLGIVASFVLQQRFAFRGAVQRSKPQLLLRFTAVAVVGALTAMFASAAFRYGLGLDRWLGEWGAGTAFAAGALTAAGLSYLLNLKLVFVPAARTRPVAMGAQGQRADRIR